MFELPPHHLKVALIHPQIAPNTGNIARLCVATGAELHLVRPLGFTLDDRNMKRSAMDYWPRLNLTVHDDLAALLRHIGHGRFWLFTTRASRNFWEAEFGGSDYLIFGSETAGLPPSLLEAHPDRCLRIPQAANERCLNVSTAAGIALYEAMRHLSR